MIIKTPGKPGHVIIEGRKGMDCEPMNGIHTLEWLSEKFSRTYKYDSMHAKISALKFRYAVLESHGELIPADTLDKDLQALAEIAECCINNG
nr:MAG TPA: hypothetical protein [Caudoviricetes sp.]